LEIETLSPEETADLGRRVGKRLGPGAVVALVGELGSGKTVFVRGLVEGAGAGSFVASPTYVIQRNYPGVIPVRHFDLYRLSAPVDLEAIGFDDGAGDSISVVEWGDRAAFEEVLVVEMSIVAERERRIVLTAHGKTYEAALALV